MIKKINNKQFKKKRTRVLVALLLAFVLYAQISPHIALARSSGGGDSAKFDTGKFAVSVGIALASAYIGAAIADGINASATGGGFFAGGGLNPATGGTYAGFSGAILDVGNLGAWANSYSSMFALSQVGAAVSMMGQQQKWDTSQTVFVSSMVTGAVGGGLNPAGSLGSSILSGTIAGTTEGAILANNIDKDGTIKPWVNAAAGMAGAFTGGIASAYTAKVIPTDISSKSFHMTKNFGEAFTHGAVKAFSAIPSELIGMGVSNITKDMDKQDAFMVRQAFSGLYPIVGSGYKYMIRNPILRSPILKGMGLDLEKYTGHDGTSGSDWRKLNRQIDVMGTQIIQTPVIIDTDIGTK